MQARSGSAVVPSSLRLRSMCTGIGESMFTLSNVMFACTPGFTQMVTFCVAVGKSSVVSVSSADPLTTSLFKVSVSVLVPVRAWRV